MSFKEDTAGTIAWYDVFTFVLPILQSVIKRLKKEFVFIPLWKDKENKYVYHIDPQIRHAMYDYLKDDEDFKKAGIVFGNDLLLGGGRKKLFDIGIYAVLPFHEIYKRYGGVKISGGQTIAELCIAFSQNIKKKDKTCLYKANVAAESLLKFVFEKCNKENFTELLVAKDCKFAKAYNLLLDRVKKEPESYRQRVLTRFLKASFHGMYVSSESFIKLAITAKPDEIKEQAEIIASKISLAAVREVKRIKGLSIFEKLAAVFKPETGRGVLEKELGGLPSISFILTSEDRVTALKYLFEVFKNNIYFFDKEVREKFGGGATAYQRIPIILNIYRDKNAKTLRSVAAGYDKKSNAVQQIKFSKREFKNAFKRCAAVATKYYVENPECLPSEMV